MLQRRLSARDIGLCLLLPLAGCAPPDASRPPPENGELTLVILDASTREAVPARVELLDARGKGHVARDALPVLREAPRPRSTAPIDSKFEVTRRFPNPQTGTDQFYSTGRSSLSLPPGTYRLGVWKGLEYRQVRTKLGIAAGEASRLEVELTRWVDMPRRGWYSADDHLHLPRPTPEANAGLHQWMAAEDIHVANLLQMGSSTAFDFAPQYAHGKSGRHGQGHHILVSGQENPRAHFLGHTIILGTDSPIHYPDEYLDFTRFFAEGRRQGALNGFGHFGQHAGAQFGLSLVLPHGLLDFLEVLQFEQSRYDIWYKILNTGFRLSPTAGTDYPWGDSYPGRERFYTRVGGRFTVEKWIAAVRAGRTFVTNGPMLRFRVDDRPMGSTIELAQQGTVDVTAAVEFEWQRDNVSELELVEDGVVVRTFPVGKRRGSRIARRFQHEVRQSGWLAIRAIGQKRRQPVARQSLAHSAPIYISVANTPPLSGRDEARRLARSWIVILDDLEASLADDNIQGLADRVASAPVDVDTIRQNRPGLLNAIREAREYFHAQSR